MTRKVNKNLNTDNGIEETDFVEFGTVEFSELSEEAQEMCRESMKLDTSDFIKC